LYAVRGGSVNHASVRVCNPRYGFPRGNIRQTEKDYIRAVCNAGALGYVFAQSRVDIQKLNLRARTQPVGKAQAGCALAAVDENLNAHICNNLRKDKMSIHHCKAKSNSEYE
jgi:hypothetical protein